MSQTCQVVGCDGSVNAIKRDRYEQTGRNTRGKFFVKYLFTIRTPLCQEHLMLLDKSDASRTKIIE